MQSIESAKSRAWRACVLACLACLCACVLTCLACLRACVLTCLVCLSAYVLGLLTCLRAYVLGMSSWLRAYVLGVLTCLACLRVCMLTCLACLRAYVLTCLVCLRVYVRASYDEMFYFLTCLRTWCAFLSYLLYISILKFKNSHSKKIVCFVKLNIFLIYILIPTKAISIFYNLYIHLLH